MQMRMMGWRTKGLQELLVLFEKEVVTALESLFPDVLFILSNRNHAEPKDPYCLVDQVSITPTSEPYRTFTHSVEDKNEYLFQNVESKFNLIFRSKSDSFLQNISTRFLLSSGSSKFRLAFNKENLSLQDIRDLNVSNEVVSDTNMLRTNIITLTVVSMVQVKENVDSINSVSVLGYEEGRKIYDKLVTRE